LGRGLATRASGQKSINLTLSNTGADSREVESGFRGGAFNLFNWVNFGAPDSNVEDPGFGIISNTATSPHILQFALKLGS
jgi:hypothetical protein